MSDYPKFQYSRFDDDKGQYVVRSDDWSEFIKNKKMIDTIVLPVSPETPKVTADQYSQDHICPSHNVQMKEGVSKTKKDANGNPLKYWSHSTKIEGEWKRCFGKGWV